MDHEKREQQLLSMKILTEGLQRFKDKAEVLPNDSLRLTNKFGCLERPSLSHGSNDEIKCASSAIALKYSEEKGRHLIATENIRPGMLLQQ